MHVSPGLIIKGDPWW